MQEQSAVECSHGERLKCLRAKLQVEWKELAERLGLSTSMCFQVAKGSKNLSDLALFRLSELEQHSGIVPPQPTPQPTPLIVKENPPSYGKENISIVERLDKLDSMATDLANEIRALRKKLNLAKGKV